MTATIRYTFARCLVSQRWIPPLLIFVLSVVIFYPANSPALGAGSVGAVLLLPLSSWLMITAVNSEGDSQEAVSVVNVGGFVRYRFGVMLAVLSVAAVLALFSTTFALLRDGETATSPRLVQTILALVVVHLLCACAGTGLGILVARPTVRRSGFAFVLVGALTIVAMAVPFSPFRNLIGALNAPDYGKLWSTVGLFSAEALGVGLVVALVALVLARSRA